MTIEILSTISNSHQRYYYEQGDLYEDYERKFRRLLLWMEEHKNVITFLSPKGEFQADVKQLEGRDDLATELRCQMISKVALKQQVDNLWRLVNTLVNSTFIMYY